MTTSGPAAEDTAAPYAAPGAPTAVGREPTRIRVRHLQEMKERGKKFSALTSYDAFTAAIFDQAGIEVLLVGDSAASTVYGYRSSLPVTVDELIPLARAVTSSARRAFVLADLPFGSYQASPEQAYATAARFMKEARVAAVKLEGGADMAPQIERLVRGGIPVCAHIGFTPQSEHTLSGYRVQGRGAPAESALLRDALAVQAAGAFAVLIEMVPAALAARVTAELDVPTIGIGAGSSTDAQVLVWQDAAGLNPGPTARFVKKYADLHGQLLTVARTYADEVKNGLFPGPEQTYD